MSEGPTEQPYLQDVTDVIADARRCNHQTEATPSLVVTGYDPPRSPSDPENSPIPPDGDRFLYCTAVINSFQI